MEVALYDGREVANFILDKCDLNGIAVTNLALQKIVYFCHVWSLIQLGKPLIREQFEAWELGPVLPYLYREHKDSEANPIRKRGKVLNKHTGIQEIAHAEFEKETKLLLEEVTGFYARLDANTLVKLSHAECGPWHSVWHHENKINPGMKLSDLEITRFYSTSNCPLILQ